MASDFTENVYLPRAMLENTPSRQRGLPAEEESKLRRFGCELIQEAGLLLKMSVKFDFLSLNEHFDFIRVILKLAFKLSSVFSPWTGFDSRPQVAIATAQVLLQRFYFRASMYELNIKVRHVKKRVFSFWVRLIFPILCLQRPPNTYSGVLDT